MLQRRCGLEECDATSEKCVRLGKSIQSESCGGGRARAFRDYLRDRRAVVLLTHRGGGNDSERCCDCSGRPRGAGIFSGAEPQKSDCGAREGKSNYGCRGKPSHSQCDDSAGAGDGVIALRMRWFTSATI